MLETWVVNSSPVITLAKAELLALLEPSEVRVLLPETVALEILAGAATDPARRALEREWGTRLPDAPVPAVLAAFALDPGEEAVLALALQESGATAVIDDLRARRVADRLPIARMGTLGLVLRAKQRGELASASEVLRSLKGVGLYLPDALIREALTQLGETWE